MGTANKDVYIKAIFAVMNTTWAALKVRPEKNSGLYGIWTRNHLWIPVQSSKNWANLSQLWAGYYVGSK